MRPIDADALKERLVKILNPGKDVKLETYIDQIVTAVIDEAPTIGTEPIRRGQWEKGCICSECGYGFGPKNASMKHCYNYCTKCGAKMDGGAEE